MSPTASAVASRGQWEHHSYGQWWQILLDLTQFYSSAAVKLNGRLAVHVMNRLMATPDNNNKSEINYRVYVSRREKKKEEKKKTKRKKKRGGGGGEKMIFFQTKPVDCWRSKTRSKDING